MTVKLRLMRWVGPWAMAAERRTSKNNYAHFNNPVLRRPVELAQFRSRKYVHALNRHALVGSMGRVRAAGDNAAMESFIALLQMNVLDRRAWATHPDLRIAIVT